MPLRTLVALVWTILASPPGTSAQDVPITTFGIQPNASEDAGPAVRKAIEYLRAHPGATLRVPPRRLPLRGRRRPPRSSSSSRTPTSSTRGGWPSISTSSHTSGSVATARGSCSATASCRSRYVGRRTSRSPASRSTGPRPLMSEGTVAAADADGITLRIDRAAVPVRRRGWAIVLRGRGPARSSPGTSWSSTRRYSAVAARTGDAGCLGRDWRGYTASEPSPGLRAAGSPLREAAARRQRPRGAARGPRPCRHVHREQLRGGALGHRVPAHLRARGAVAVLERPHVPERARQARARLVAAVRRARRRLPLLELPREDPGRPLLVLRADGRRDQRPRHLGGGHRARKAPRTVACRFMHDQSVGLRFGDPGDEISILDRASMLPVGRRRSWHSAARGSATSRSISTPTSPSLPPGGLALENLTWTPEVTIRGSLFGGGRARGLLLTTPRTGGHRGQHLPVERLGDHHLG